MGRTAEKLAFSLIRETCPAVDAAFSEAAERITDLADVEAAFDWLCKRVKDVGTEPLRAALIEVCARAIEAEERAEEQEKRADRLEREVADLKHDIRNLEKELNEERA